MNDILNKTFIFVAGAAIGSMVIWKLVKTKYEKIAKEEIESVKETFSRGRRTRLNMIDEVDSEDEYEPSEDEKNNYKDIINSNGYSTKKEVDEKMGKPYVISPDDFDENDYTTESLTYYADGVLTDMYDNIIEDVEGTVGVDSLSHFGEFEDDSVFVRNDEAEIDYEILRDLDKYYDKYPEEK